MSESLDFTIEELGNRNIHSPIAMSKTYGDLIANYVRDDEFVVIKPQVSLGEQPPLKRSDVLELAGPREMIYFTPHHVHAGIVSCGGLCPGINDVIRAIVRCLVRYGVTRISGIRFGYKGFLPEYHFDVIPLDQKNVDDIHKLGGTFLGSARGGGKEVEKIVDAMEQLNMNVLFTIGGDGTQRGSLDIANEIEKRGLKIATVGIPKTVDNDFSFIERSFGFDTAVSKAVDVVTAAHMEAVSAINGIGLVKVMGRESGFIAVHTALASHEVNFVLIPEVPFDLEGPNGFFHHLEMRLQRRNHAVIVIAEGALQDQLIKEVKTDAGGNVKMEDVGSYMRDQIQKYFSDKKIEINLKYIDPSYIIRSAPASPVDSIYCERLGNAAAHAAMAGKNKCIIGLVNGEFVHLPTKVAVSQRNHVDPEGSLWRDCQDATQQPVIMLNNYQSEGFTAEYNFS
ncbi:diphosphate--fructose-6-phosphate 1-phosphotransferase [Treponema primitia ZAS-2]|uniref:ATP-dependent 6-phosphofructokinase n=1 Tax=Treponema primitia (strain ATCC BAA-887 / DSM 12427 / ZAS-2) TaxID=545694 RepID=F5YKN3_TREPZ|nr:ATP-dependent 6-phosphofructokinase [Treponema primitia]AEF85190.1 diphosphate--fructose-6-phosphate 1-phosphotransferase [Treponema primitia ZAS-2]